MQLSKLDSSLIFRQPVRTCHVIYHYECQPPMLLNWRRTGPPLAVDSPANRNQIWWKICKSIVKATIRVHTTTNKFSTHPKAKVDCASSLFFCSQVLTHLPFSVEPIAICSTTWKIYTWKVDVGRKRYCRMSQHSDFLVTQWIPQYLKESKVDLFPVCKFENPLLISWDIQKRLKKNPAHKTCLNSQFFCLRCFLVPGPPTARIKASSMVMLPPGR